MAQRRVNLPALTGLRFFAAIYVVIFHSTLPHLDGLPTWVQTFVKNGPVGVSLFFVLSGFILAYTYHGLTVTKRDFWTARLARVYPVYILGLILAFPVFVVKVLSATEGNAAVGLFTSSGAAVLLLLQAWVPEWSCLWNCPGWSLSAEAFFYLTFPFLLAPISRTPTRRLIATAAALWVVALLPPLLYIQFFGGIDALLWKRAVEYNPLLRLSEFAVGVIAGVIFTRIQSRQPRPKLWATLAIPATCVAVFAALAAPSGSYSLMVQTSLLTPLFAFVILALAWQDSSLGRALSKRPFQLLGEASYSLYIIHYPILAWFVYAGGFVGVSPLTSPMAWLVYIAVCLAASLAVLKKIEEPMRRIVRQRLHSPRKATAPKDDVPAGERPA